MSWRVALSPEAAEWLRKADPQVARRIRDALRMVASLDDPRSRGKGLTAGLAGLWRYRVGDYRVICDIRDRELVILALDVGKRDEVYG
ncbi:MAG: type II toxin-antitoxin system RelE/ParE family toxin [Micropruina sp.]|uniref:type II toxin-antitoxin system RelE family toxin n=1 Tax=Micropruina sp. TaxID=2737536 RepID=UPI0039E2FAE9